MAVTDFIVAIELGSSKISGIAGKKLPDGSIQILAMASENASDCIRKGVIYNLDKTTQSLTSIIKKLESTLKASIGKVYIGMGGQSLRTIRNTEVRHMDEETKISQELIDTLKDSNRAVPIVGYQILGVAPQEYKVGNDLIVDPVGVQTDHIEARFLNIIARKNVKDNVAKCCDLVPIEIAEDAEDLIAPLALADAVLTSSEKRSGCVLVDFGADTTTVSVYKNNILRHLAVIPLGGNNITRDICSQQIEEEDAEALKIRFAQAYIEPNENEDENKTYNLDGRCSINAILLEDIVEARLNEILDNVTHQIVLSGYENKLLAGLIGQLSIASMVYFWCGISFRSVLPMLPWWIDFPFTVFWIVGAVNAFNLIDGLDGLASGLAVIAATGMAGSLFFLESPGQMFLYLAFIGSLLGFLRYNFNPASIFLGDTGSMFLGFFLSTMPLATNTSGSFLVGIGVPLLAMGVPIFDTALAIVRRTVRALIKKESNSDRGGTKLMQPDSDHIHHRLLRRFVSQRKTAVGCMHLRRFLSLSELAA